jgi:hypothetical protein
LFRFKNKWELAFKHAMQVKFLTAILNKTKRHRIRNINIRLELGVDEMKNDIQKSSFKIVWTRDADERREDT